MECLEIFKKWVLSLCEKYSVNPYIFGGINSGLNLLKPQKNIRLPMKIGQKYRRDMSYQQLFNDYKTTNDLSGTRHQ